MDIPARPEAMVFGGRSGNGYVEYGGYGGGGGTPPPARSTPPHSRSGSHPRLVDVGGAKRR